MKTKTEPRTFTLGKNMNTNKTILTLLMAVITSTLLFSTSVLRGQDLAEPAKKQAVMKNGKLFIIDDEGVEHEFDTSNARSVAIQQSIKIVEQDGERVEVSGGTATIVDANGEKTVVEFENKGGEGGVEFPNFEMEMQDVRERILEQIEQIEQFENLNGARFPLRVQGPRMNVAGVFRPTGEVGEYMVGAGVSPVGEALRRHLRLEENAGLIIESIGANSPATEAGLQRHDILLFADDQSLGTQKELTTAVDLAGEEERSLTLIFIRDGEEQSTEITPKKRPVGRAKQRGGFPRVRAMPGGRIDIRQMGPGVILPDNMNPRMDEIMEQLRADFDNLEKELKLQK